MKSLTKLIIVGVVAWLSSSVLLADEKESFIYVTYFNCDVSLEDRIDKLVEEVDKPVFDAAVEDGTISGWGWLAHHTGGKWRRARYHSANSVEQLIAALDAIDEKQDEKATAEMGEICKSHDDYIWRGVTGSGGDILATERGKVGLSAYYVCDAREGVADEIVKTVFAPVYDSQVADGKLTSWGWAEHIVGGKYRRLGTMTAKDWPSLFAARDSILEAGQDSELAREFADICGSHVDYMWEIRYENP
jgi:hypothetical protein